MDKKDFLALLDKFQAGKTNEEEKQLLINYFQSFQERNDWPPELGEPDELKDKMLKRLLNSIDLDKTGNNGISRSFPYTILKYAAVLIVAAGLLFLYTSKDSKIPLEVVGVSESENTITLKLENGAIDVIAESESKKIMDPNGNVIGVQNGNELNYQKKENRLKKLVYNELRVPHGKRFDLVLFDGTKIKLNAGSTIKYPIEFIDGKNREVQIWGEAFFDVTEDKNHPFIVHANNIGVRVLGTKFNVASYEEDEHINTVLIEGSVQLFQDKENNPEDNFSILKPSYKASWSKNGKKMSIEKVDTSIYTSWINGKLVFKNSPFKNIRRKLERHYNVTIINNNSSLDEKLYNASFDIETIEQVMEAFKENYAIDFTINGNQITIN